MMGLRPVVNPVCWGSVSPILLKLTILTEVLRPVVVDQALTRALELLRTDADGSGRRQALTRDLAAVEVGLAT